MNVLNRPLFQRYARRPAPQGPVGIMASSPELMQAAAQYNTGGLVERTDIDPSEILKGLTPMPMVQPNPFGISLPDKNLGGGNPQPLGMFQAPKTTTQHLEDIGNSVGGIQEDIRRAGVNINTASGNLDTARSMLGIEKPSGVDFATTIGLAEGGPVLGYRKGTVVRPTVDITQEPVEFKETITETETVTQKPMQIAPSTRTRTSIIAPPQTGSSEVEEAIKAGEQFEQAGETANVRPELAAAAEAVVNPDKTSSEEATEILSSLGKDVPKGTKGKIDAMKSLISDTFGVDASRYDNLKALNRAAVGFAIAKGDDIAAALESGARGAAAIEQSRLSREDSMSQMALQQVFAEKLAGMRNAAAMAGKASDYTPERLRQRVIEAILRSPDQFNVYDEATGSVDPIKVQREADILVKSMVQNQSPSTDMPATGSDPAPTMTHQQANDAAKEKGEPFYILDGKKFKVQ